jgi:hypothetical protein
MGEAQIRSVTTVCGGGVRFAKAFLLRLLLLLHVLLGVRSAAPVIVGYAK